jgi:hypothetical protein
MPVRGITARIAFQPFAGLPASQPEERLMLDRDSRAPLNGGSASRESNRNRDTSSLYWSHACVPSLKAVSQNVLTTQAHV